jgi:predicted SnoaL-like aldol condensation-catalyzing enzyme
MTTTTNATQFRRLIEDGFGRGDLSVVDEVVASDVVEHQRGIPPGNSGPERIKRLIGGLRGAFPDLTCDILHVVTDGDLVWGHFRARGTQTGDFLGVPPTGKAVAIEVIDICRFVDGTIVEHWGVPDRLGVLEQIGAFVPHPIVPAGAGSPGQPGA